MRTHLNVAYCSHLQQWAVATRIGRAVHAKGIEGLKMKHVNQHLPPMRRKSRIGAILAAALLLALAAPAVAHVVEATIQPFLSRYYNTEDAVLNDFNTFKLVGTFILVR